MHTMICYSAKASNTTARQVETQMTVGSTTLSEKARWKGTCHTISLRQNAPECKPVSRDRGQPGGCPRACWEETGEGCGAIISLKPHHFGKKAGRLLIKLNIHFLYDQAMQREIKLYVHRNPVCQNCMAAFVTMTKNWQQAGAHQQQNALKTAMYSYRILPGKGNEQVTATHSDMDAAQKHTEERNQIQGIWLHFLEDWAKLTYNQRDQISDLLQRLISLYLWWRKHSISLLGCWLHMSAYLPNSQNSTLKMCASHRVFITSQWSWLGNGESVGSWERKVKGNRSPRPVNLRLPSHFIRNSRWLLPNWVYF